MAMTCGAETNNVLLHVSSPAADKFFSPIVPSGYEVKLHVLYSVEFSVFTAEADLGSKD